MRGSDRRSEELFCYVDVERRIRRDHPLRSIRGVVNEALSALSGEFAALYGSTGRPSIPPEMLLRAMLLQAFYSIRSVEQFRSRCSVSEDELVDVADELGINLSILDDLLALEADKGSSVG